MKMSTSAWIMLIALSLLWGSSFFLVEIALQGFPVMVLVTLRVAIAAIVLWCIVALSSAAVPRSMSVWSSFLLMGILNNILPFSLIVWGQTEITSSLAAILNATTPLFAVLIAAIWLHDEPVTPGKITGLLLGFLGVVIMIGADTIREIGSDVLAQLAVVLASCSYALATAFGRRFAALGIAPTVSAACQVTMSGLLLVLFVTVTSGWSAITVATTVPWLAVIALAVLSTALAYVLYFNILATAGATNLTLVTFLIPVTAIALGVLVLHERLQATDYLGLFLIVFALVAIDGRLLSRPQRWT